MSLFRKITETVSKGVSTATEKAQQTVEVTRLHSQISGKRREIEKLYVSMGEAVFRGYLDKDLSRAETKVIPACEEIVAIRGEVEALEERIMQLRNEKECVCGRKVPYDTRFCPSCGHPFPEPAIPAAEDPLEEFDRQETEPSGLSSADPFVEPPGYKDPGEAPSASDWADVGKPVLEEVPSAWSDAGQATPSFLDDADAVGAERADSAKCPGCGTAVGTTAKFCPSCGTPQQ
ncbi:zinc ribbon domain-containing protein [Cohnella candidum]|uniref:Zinc-ribbon domain-containing protein n=1 Tax=Cohnella candidum TaxID=2674991 RepID=A0A3G3JZD8_9BACL|nr:zinc ribbon domain-containing protein [Cohnella candidum]AYQ72869.1 hypothetical protein EAV92_10025 [Cohnella candidum]